MTGGSFFQAMGHRKQKERKTEHDGASRADETTKHRCEDCSTCLNNCFSFAYDMKAEAKRDGEKEVNNNGDSQVLDEHTHARNLLRERGKQKRESGLPEVGMEAPQRRKKSHASTVERDEDSEES